MRRNGRSMFTTADKTEKGIKAYLLSRCLVNEPPAITQGFEHEIDVVELVSGAALARRHAGDVCHGAIQAIEGEEVVPPSHAGALVLEGCAVDVHCSIVVRK